MHVRDELCANAHSGHFREGGAAGETYLDRRVVSNRREPSEHNRAAEREDIVHWTFSNAANRECPDNCSKMFLTFTVTS